MGATNLQEAVAGCGDVCVFFFAIRLFDRLWPIIGPVRSASFKILRSPHWLLPNRGQVGDSRKLPYFLP
jgi:hypothetical protein